MQTLLDDALSGDCVILAPARALRPESFRVVAPPRVASSPSCPFCDGNEFETPPEVTRLGPGAPNAPGWRVRVVPNKYPIVGDGVPGAHEVIVFSSAHDADVGVLSPEACIDALRAMRDRARFHLEQGRVYAQVFVNHGKAAGASIEHPHGQLVALDFVPPRIRTLAGRFAAAERDLVVDDARHGEIVSAGDVNVWCPHASLTPFAVRIALSVAGARFDESSDDETDAVALALHDLVGRYHRLLGEPSYNLVVSSAPRDAAGPFHWWIDAVPRLTVRAGFELGTGIWVNTVPPADAARALRGV